MLRFIAQRLLQAAAVLLAISILVFVMMYIVGDPVATLLPPTASQQQRAEMRELLGLDQPLAVQYMRYFSRTVRGDFGISYYTGRPVLDEIAERVPATLELATVSLLLSVLVGLPLGVWAAARPRNPLAQLATGGSLLGISIPTFWLGLMLMMVFGVALGWLPTQGRGEHLAAFAGLRWSLHTLNGWRHVLLPAATLALYHLAMLLRLTRAEMSDTLRRPFVTVCRARGLPEWRVIGKHALRNTLIPVVTIVGLQFGGLLAFSVVTETVFQWPGLGKLLIDRIQVDRPLVVAYLMLTGVVFITINLIVDLLYGALDPRIRWSERRV